MSNFGRHEKQRQIVVKKKTSPETEARNAYYKDPGRRAWALIAFMVEHEEYKVAPDATIGQRQSDTKGRLIFRATELHKQLLASSAGYGGYYHPGAAGSSRTNVIQAMTDEAERQGWVTRERERYGGVYNYALTAKGREAYRDAIKPQRDTFVESYLKTKKTASKTAALHSVTVQATNKPRGKESESEHSAAASERFPAPSGSRRRRDRLGEHDGLPPRSSIEHARSDPASGRPKNTGNKS